MGRTERNPGGTLSQPGHGTGGMKFLSGICGADRGGGGTRARACTMVREACRDEVVNKGNRELLRSWDGTSPARVSRQALRVAFVHVGTTKPHDLRST